jgi:hypothetical protein
MKARTTEICIQAKKILVTPNFQGPRFSNSQGMIHLIWPPKFIFDPIKPQQPTIQLFFTWNMLLSIKSRNGAQKESPLPWFGVIPIAKCGLILAPWSGQHINKKKISAFSQSRYLKFSKGGQILGTLGARVP